MKKIKTILIFLLVAVISLSVFTACSKQDNQAPSDEFVSENESSTAAESETSTTEAETSKEEELLTDEEIIRLYIEANKLYTGWISGAFTPEFDKKSEPVVEGNKRYYKITSGEFSSKQELDAALSRYFTKDIYEEKLNEYYVQKSDGIYAYEMIGQGGETPPDAFQLINIYKDEKECLITVVKRFGTDRTYIDLRLLKIDGNWIFSEVFGGSQALYLNEDIQWVE